MSVTERLRRLSDADLKRLRKNPDLIGGYLYDGAVDGFGPFVEQDLDKAWHGIHFLLTGLPFGGDAVAGFLMTGGKKVGDVDVGYGPARGFKSRGVRAIADHLRSLPPDALRDRFDPEAMSRANIYPAIWDRTSERDENLHYLLSHYEALRGFVLDASEAGEALLVWSV